MRRSGSSSDESTVSQGCGRSGMHTWQKRNRKLADAENPNDSLRSSSQLTSVIASPAEGCVGGMSRIVVA